MANINYAAPPTCARFMKSNAFGRIIAGPVGSGKTTACLFEMLRRSCEQIPAPDGLRYTRWAIVRQTLKQLKDTVLKDITGWLQGVAHYKVSDNTVYIQVGDVRSEWILIPLETPEDQRRLLSMQLTGAWMSECIEMDIGLVAPLSGRCGRYPGPALGGASWFGIIADTNFPAEGGDWHKFMALETPADWQIFEQPGGMAPNAENLPWLTQTPDTLARPEDDPVRIAQGRTYYERFVRQYGEDSDWVQRYVHAKYGDDPSGSAVFRESFRQSFHVVDEIEPVNGHPILIGQDFGRDPCSVIGQVDHKGRLLILGEAAAEDTGLELHVIKTLRPMLLDPRYFGKACAMIGDPAGRAKSTLYEETSFDLLKRLGFAAYPAPTNDIDPRIRAVEAWLTGARDGGPAMLIDRRYCPGLIRALGGGYRYGRTKGGLRKPSPDKNQFSHIADALQYLCLVAHGQQHQHLARHMMRRGSGVPRVRPSAAGWT